MTNARYWEDRAGVIQEEVSAERAAACFAAAAADPHSGLVGTLHEFHYWAFYGEGVGNAFRVRFRRLTPRIDVAAAVLAQGGGADV
jgi:hypothetical protein